jgi:calcineurin-like phosphoesterase family protein
MKNLLTVRTTKESDFTDYMKSLYFEGWENVLSPDQILWHWEEFLQVYPLPF